MPDEPAVLRSHSDTNVPSRRQRSRRWPGADAAKEAGALLAITMVLCAPSFAHAGNVRGRLLVGNYQAGSETNTACYWEVENGFKEIARDRLDVRRELAVILVGDGAARGDSDATHTVEFNGGGLLPLTIALRPNTTLRIRNADQTAHELYAEGLDGFSAEVTAAGAVRTVRVTSAGNWPLRDQLAPHAHGHLHVLENLVAIAELQDNGSFVLSNVPTGDYTLKVLHRDAELVSKPVKVQERGDLTLDPLSLMDAKP